MRRSTLSKFAGVLAVAAVYLGASTSALGAIVNLTTAGSSGKIRGATFQQINQEPTGTGVIDSFLRIKKIGNEAAYNTSGQLAKTTFDQLSGAWNRDLLLSSIPVVNGSYQFLLDINEANSTIKSLLSLNQLQVFRTSTPGQTGGTRNATTGYLTGLNGTTVYDMNPGGGIANGVTLNYDLNNGSGSGDMFLYIPTSAFANKIGDYVVLYSQFGNPPGKYASDAGFEEWAVIQSAAVPEPTTMIAGALLLLPFGASTIRILRRNRKA